MRLINDKPLVVMRWEELAEMLKEIPVEKIVTLSWFQWAMGSSHNEDYVGLSHEKLLSEIFTEMEEQTS